MSVSATAHLAADMRQWRHAIHRHPELGFTEHETAKLVVELLTSWGIEVHKNVGNTGVVGVLQRGNGNRCIGLRADMDALAIDEKNTFEHRSQRPGIMHACGHDGHTAMLLGAAKCLAENPQFSGTVVFIFQPAEEHGKGAKAMIDDGLFERFAIDDVYAIHNFPSIEAGRFVVRSGGIMASEDNFKIVINGVGHHAAMPHRGIDPLVVAAQIITAAQTIVSRRLDPTQQAVLSFTEIVTDGAVNVVPNTVTLTGDARSFSAEVQDLIDGELERIAKGICQANNCRCDYEYVRAFDATINDPTATARVHASVAARFGEEAILPDFTAPMTSEDFAFMLQQRPGCYVLLGNDRANNPAQQGGCGLHHPNYDFNDEILTMGADLWVQLIQDQLQ